MVKWVPLKTQRNAEILEKKINDVLRSAGMGTEVQIKSFAGRPTFIGMGGIEQALHWKWVVEPEQQGKASQIFLSFITWLYISGKILGALI